MNGEMHKSAYPLYCKTVGERLEIRRLQTVSEANLFIFFLTILFKEKLMAQNFSAHMSVGTKNSPVATNSQLIN